MRGEHSRRSASATMSSVRCFTFPTPLRKLTNDEELVEVNAATIGDAINELQIRFPGIKERLMDESGAVRRFVNVYVNEEDIRFLQNQSTPLKDGDEISIIPAIAGG